MKILIIEIIDYKNVRNKIINRKSINIDGKYNKSAEFKIRLFKGTVGSELILMGRWLDSRVDKYLFHHIQSLHDAFKRYRKCYMPGTSLI